MNDPQVDDEAAYRAIRMEIAKADLKLKQMEIRYRPGPWKQLLTNPILIGGLITAYVTAGTAYLSAQRGREQQKLDGLNHVAQLELEEEKLESGAIIEIAKVSEPGNIGRNVQLFLEMGLIKDRSGKIRDYIKTHPAEGSNLTPRSAEPP